MDMSIAAMSVNMHQSQAMQDMGMAVLKMAMDTTEVAAEEMLESGHDGGYSGLKENCCIRLSL